MKIFSVGTEQKPGQRFSISGAPSLLSFEDVGIFSFILV